MKIVLWVSVVVLGAVWTAGFALLASIAHWLAGAGPHVVGAVQQVAEWPVPAWVAIWASPAGMDGVRAGLTGTIDFLVLYSPWLFSLLGWVAPLLWALWGLGVLLLLGAAALGHRLLGRVPPTAGQG